MRDLCVASTEWIAIYCQPSHTTRLLNSFVCIAYVCPFPTRCANDSSQRIRYTDTCVGVFVFVWQTSVRNELLTFSTLFYECQKRWNLFNFSVLPRFVSIEKWLKEVYSKGSVDCKLLAILWIRALYGSTVNNLVYSSAIFIWTNMITKVIKEGLAKWVCIDCLKKHV